MDPDLTLSLMSDNNAATVHQQPSNAQLVANIPSTQTPYTVMDPDLARALFQNNNTSTPKPSHRHPIQHHRCSNSAPRRSDASQHFAPRPPPPDPSSSHASSELMKVLYHTPGIQARDYHIMIAVCMQFLVT